MIENKHKVGDVVWHHNGAEYMAKGTIIFCNSNTVVVADEHDYYVKTNNGNVFKTFDEAKFALLKFHGDCAQRHMKMSASVMSMQEPKPPEPPETVEVKEL